MDRLSRPEVSHTGSDSHPALERVPEVLQTVCRPGICMLEHHDGSCRMDDRHFSDRQVKNPTNVAEAHHGTSRMPSVGMIVCNSAGRVPDWSLFILSATDNPVAFLCS